MFSLILDKEERRGRERGEGEGEEERERDLSWLPPEHAPTKDQTHNLGMISGGDRTHNTWCAGWCSNPPGRPARAVILLHFHHSRVICKDVVLLLSFPCIYLFSYFFPLLFLFALLHWLEPTVQCWTEMVILDTLPCFWSQYSPLSTLAVSVCVHSRFRKLLFIPRLLMNFLSISCKADLMAFDSLFLFAWECLYFAFIF